MDDACFDRLTKTLSTAGSRRGLLGLVVALPGLGGLGGVVDAVAAGEVEDAGGRRKKGHKHGKGRRRKGHDKKPQSCRPASRATTCAGKCGAVDNNCQQTIACGSCACEPPCAVCQTCQEAPNIPGACVPDPAQVGDACGAGRFCRDDGRCRCDADSCAECSTCQEDGVCSVPCEGEGCCADGTCEPGDTLAACGVDGERCQVCADDELCWHGRCVCGDVCADGCQFATLWEAMDAVDVKPGATLRLCAETYAGVSILKDLTLLGVGDGEDGTVIRGQGRGAVVGIGPKVTAVLRGLRITGGAATMVTLNGGGIYNGGDSLTLIDCTVTGNVAGNTGGGIYGGDVTLINSRVTNNHAGVKAGGIHGARYSLQNSVVSGNTARFRGGGIVVNGLSELVGTEVMDNVAEEDMGGGILCSGTLRLTNSQVTDNKAATQGGGIHNDGGELTLEQSQITDNEAAEGGGIYFKKYPQAGAVTLTDSTVADNDPDNCAGDPVAGCSS